MQKETRKLIKINRNKYSNTAFLSQYNIIQPQGIQIHLENTRAWKSVESL